MYWGGGVGSSQTPEEPLAMTYYWKWVSLTQNLTVMSQCTEYTSISLQQDERKKDMQLLSFSLINTITRKLYNLDQDITLE